ncbi:MAG: M60 family metallopeptidase [Rikenellaceae bacterium]|nr:M60 family metallopeptidase [Rikenellaceae bacterium]
MKKNLLLLFAVIAAFVGCQNDTPDDGNPDVKHYVQAECDTLYLGSASSADNTIYINSHSNFWSYSYDESQEWCFIQDAIDENGQRYLIVETNENKTDNTRELTITITNGDAADQIVISQLVNSEKPATTISLADQSYSFPKEMTTFSVDVTTDGSYEIDIPEECTWISHDGTTKGEGVVTETFYLSANYGDEIRSVEVSLVSPNTSAKIEIIQWGKIDLKVDADKKNLTFAAGSDSLHVEAATEYTAKITEGDWVTINTELSKNGLIVFDYEMNESETDPRTAVITIATANTTKEVTLTQIPYNLTEMPEGDNWIDDIPATITLGEGSSQLSTSRKVERAFDGNTLTAWQSAPKNDKPQELILNIDASKLDRIDYLRYVPIPSSNSNPQPWGRWGEVDVYATDAEGNESLVLTHDFLLTGNSTDVVFEPALPNTTTRVRFVIKSAIPYVEKNVEYPNVAGAAEVGVFMYNPEGFQALQYFTDWSLSELRDEVTYEQISQIKDPFYRSLAEQIFYGTYDDEFRVCEFQAYPHPERDSKKFRDTAFSPLDNVTGMFVHKAGDPQYIYIDEDYGLDIYVRIVDYANHEGAVGTSVTDHTYDYKVQKGRNVIIPKYRGLMYIYAITDNYKNIPTMKAHFLNSGVNGYIKKGVHTAEDVARIFGLATFKEEPRFDVVSDRAIINFTKDLFRRNTFLSKPRENGHRVFALMDIYDTMVNIVEDFEGFTKYGHRHTHRVMIHEGETNNAGYSSYSHICARQGVGFWVDPDGIWPRKATTMNASVVNSGWTLFHEFGHATQTQLFKWIGLTEVTNNFMCDIIQNKLYGEGKGYTNLRYGDQFNRGMRDLAARWVWDFDENGNWYERPWNYIESVNSPGTGYEKGCVDYQTRIMPFYQLYLYYHLVLGKTDFYSDFYELCRTKPIIERDFNTSNDYYNAVQEEYVKTISEASGENLSAWAEMWGLPGIHRPMGVNKGTKVNHYGQVFYTTTEEKVAEIKKYCSQFPAPKHNLLYIHDLNLELYRNPQTVVAGTHTYDSTSGIFTTSGWENVVAWVLVDPDKKEKNGEQGRQVAILQCSNPSGTDSFEYVFKESRYIPKAPGDYSDYFYNEGSPYSSNVKGTERSLEPVTGDYEYTQSLQLFAVDAFGNRYASKSNIK